MKEEILKLFKEVMPSRFNYHEDELSDIIDYMIEREADYSAWCVQSFSEDIRMKFCHQMVEHIKGRIELKDTYKGYSHHQDTEPKNEYERGVYDCYKLIYQLQHFMNPT